MKTGKILAKHVYVAANHGITISPGLAANQTSGASIMGISRALWEEVKFSKERVTSLDWVSYPILRFADSPAITTVVVAPGTQLAVVPGAENSIIAGNAAALTNGWITTGGGELGVPVAVSALANGFFDATGVRIRSVPFTPAACGRSSPLMVAGPKASPRAGCTGWRREGPATPGPLAWTRGT